MVIKYVDDTLVVLEKGIERFMETDGFQKYLHALSLFPKLSIEDQAKIIEKRPDAYLLARRDAWKELDRKVRSGEKGFRINNIMSDAANGCKTSIVYDVGQTEGAPLPSIDPADLYGDVPGYTGLLSAVERAINVPVRYSEVQGTTRGYYDRRRNEIVLRHHMSEAQTVKTLIHEAAHLLMHRSNGTWEDNRIREMEAESVAFTVCNRFGIDTSDYSFPYISGWAAAQSLDEWRKSLDRIRETCLELIDKIQKELEE